MRLQSINLQTLAKRIVIVLAGITAVLSLVSLTSTHTFAATESGSMGLEGKINTEPPKTAATITVPRDGTTVTSLPVTVSGLCTTDLLVKIFKNNVFAGSVNCKNGSYSIQIDLFSGRNEIIARVYDALDQAGPDSNMVVLNYPSAQFGFSSRVSLTSSFAKKGADPGKTLTWPISLSGGIGPYALTVDWGDGKTPDIISQSFPGTFNITHVYDNAGIYNVVVRATDKEGQVAFLQLVGVANGPLSQSVQGDKATKESANKPETTRVLWLPVLATLPLLLLAFWLGKKYEISRIRKQLETRR